MVDVRIDAGSRAAYLRQCGILFFIFESKLKVVRLGRRRIIEFDKNTSIFNLGPT